MSKIEKLLARLEQVQHGYLWSDLVIVLTAMGFRQIEGSGSRLKFVRESVVINLHKPHPQKEVKVYAVKQVRELLKNEGLL